MDKMNASLVLYILMLLAVVMSIGKWKNASDFISKLGVKKADFRKEMVTAFVYLGILLLVSVAVELVMSSLGLQKDMQRVTDVLQGANPADLFIILSIASFVEEIFFRGYLQRKTNLIFASFVFAYFHIIYGSISEIVGAFFLGLVLGKEYQKTNNLIAPIMSHFFYNLVIIALMFGA